MDQLSYFSFHPVLHDWCTHGHGMCYPVCGMVHIKESLLLIETSSPCGSSMFPLSLSVWYFTICLMPYNHKIKMCFGMATTFVAYLSVCFCVFFFSYNQSLCLLISLSHIVSLYLSVCLFIYLSSNQSINLLSCLSVCMSVYMSQAFTLFLN